MVLIAVCLLRQQQYFFNLFLYILYVQFDFAVIVHGNSSNGILKCLFAAVLPCYLLCMNRYKGQTTQGCVADKDILSSHVLGWNFGHDTFYLVELYSMHFLALWSCTLAL